MGFIDYKNFLYVKNHIAEQHRVTLSSKIDFEKLIYKLREDPWKLMTRLKKDLKNPTEQTNLTGWSKLTNKRTNVIDIRSDSHFTAKLIYQLYKLIERRHVRRTNNCLLDSHVFCSGQSLVTTTKLSYLDDR